MIFGELPAVKSIEDLDINLVGRSIKARLYIPRRQGDDAPPLTLYFHGGGWVFGTLDTHDATCRALANASGSAILSVAYRLAPEDPFPAGLEDCYDALEWANGHMRTFGVDASRLAVAGDSAGGNLAAAVAIKARDGGGPALRHQLLIYPVTDRDFTRPSNVMHGNGEYFLSTEAMQWFWRQYLPDGSPADPPLAAIYAMPDLSRLAPATIIAAEYDPLCDEGMAYGRRLAEAGVEVEATIAPGMIHGFMSLFGAIPDALPWIGLAGARLRGALA